MPVKGDKMCIRDSRMASDNKIAVVDEICGNIYLLGPMLVGRAETPGPLELMQGIGKHPRGALEAIFVQHGL